MFVGVKVLAKIFMSHNRSEAGKHWQIIYTNELCQILIWSDIVGPVIIPPKIHGAFQMSNKADSCQH